MSRTFIVIEPETELCNLFMRFVSLATAGKEKVVGITSLDNAVERTAEYPNVEMVFIAHGPIIPSSGVAIAQQIRTDPRRSKTKFIITSASEGVRPDIAKTGFVFMNRNSFAPASFLRKFMETQGVKFI